VNLPTIQPYNSTERMRVCMDTAQWQVWFWDGDCRCPAGHPSLLEVDGNNDGSNECADVVDSSYGPLDWFRLEPCDPPDGAPS
jgi:hypothetical protein